jgi:beta-galactosidase
MHYWRVDPANWKACLRAMHSLGFTAVESYVPWREHEPDEGAYRWTGQHDLRRFVETAGAAGLAVILRPGPHCNAELTAFGMPDFVIADDDVQARTARGTPVWMPSPPRAWPVPSYASKVFHEYVRHWYAQVAAQIAPLLAPDGPIVAIGVDNEAQMFFRLGAFDHDYHPDAIAWFGKEAPREWSASDAARCIEWVRFKDQYLARALGEFSTSLDEVGLGGVARFHNLPPGHHGLYDLPAIQHAIGGPVGIDAYTPRTGLRELRRRGLAMTGQASPIPLVLEVGCGFFPWFPPQAKDDPTLERDQLLTLLATGARGFNLYMAVERERWYGAAISASGVVEAPWIKPLIRALEEIDWPALRRTAPIALVDTRADARFGLATSLADPLTPVLAEVLDFGPGGAAELGTDEGAIAARRWQAAITSALELAQVPYEIVSEAATAEQLARYRAVIAPTIDRVDRTLWSTLRSLAEARKAIVVIGPGTPTRDEHDQPLQEPVPKRVGRLKAGSLDDLPGLAQDLGALAEIADVWQVERPDDVRCHAFADDKGTVRAVFVLSDATTARTATLLTPNVRLRDVFSTEVIASTGRATIAVPPRGVRFYIVE